MRIVVIFLILLSSWSASAQSVYKCVDKGGIPSFQSDPCGDHAQISKVWDATPERLNEAERRRRYDANQKAATDAAYLRRLAAGTPRHSGGTAVSIPRETNHCSDARQRRDQFYANTPRRTSKDMERWSKFVYDACK